MTESIHECYGDLDSAGYPRGRDPLAGDPRGVEAPVEASPGADLLPGTPADQGGSMSTLAEAQDDHATARKAAVDLRRRCQGREMSRDEKRSAAHYEQRALDAERRSIGAVFAEELEEHRKAHPAGPRPVSAGDMADVRATLPTLAEIVNGASSD